MIWRLILLTIGILGSSFSSADELLERSVLRGDNSEIHYYLAHPSNRTTYPILLYLQGSVCVSVYQGLPQSLGFISQLGMAALQVEKYGITKDTTTCPQAYLQHNSINQRVEDYLRVLQIIRQQEPAWNRQFIIMGQSEGAVVASILAAYVPETIKLAFIAGGGGMTMAEEMEFLFTVGWRKQGKSEAEIASELANFHKQLDDIRANPVPSKVWYGDTNTYLWWNSILWLKPANLMLDLQIPILVLQGDADQSVPIESARALVAAFRAAGKSNLTYQELPGLDHQFNDSTGQSHTNEVLGMAFRWILGQPTGL